MLSFFLILTWAVLCSFIFFTIDKTIFDGKQFNAGVDLNKATDYYNAYIYNMNRVLRGWEMLSSGDAGSAQGQVLYSRLKAKQDWAIAMQISYPDFRASQSGQAIKSTAANKQKATKSGGMIDYQKQLITRYLDSENMIQDQSIFNGKDFVSGVPFPRIKNYYDGYVSGIEKANNKWQRQISSSVKNTPDGEETFKRLLAYVLDMYVSRSVRK